MEEMRGDRRCMFNNTVDQDRSLTMPITDYYELQPAIMFALLTNQLILTLLLAFLHFSHSFLPNQHQFQVSFLPPGLDLLQTSVPRSVLSSTMAVSRAFSLFRRTLVDLY